MFDICEVGNLIHTNKLSELKEYALKFKIDFSKEIGDKEFPFLFIAINDGHFEIFDYLLENGADINVVNEINVSVASIAVENDCLVDNYDKFIGGVAKNFYHCDFEFSKYVISKGVNLNIPSEYESLHTTPLDTAIEYGYYELAAFLRDNGAKTYKQLVRYLK